MILLQKTLPPAARGVLFEKTTPLDPPQKLFIIKSFLGVRMLHGRFYKKAPYASQSRRHQIKWDEIEIGAR
jgi:hypothetical protein